MKWPFLDTLYKIVWIDLQADSLAVEAGSTDFGGSVPLTRAALSPIRSPWWTTIEGEPTRFSGSKTRHACPGGSSGVVEVDVTSET